ncbi:hypothetical protein M8C21_018038, partial [Ambrosia artemisiifolia]
REISTTAKEVYLSSRSLDVKVSRLEGYKNIWQHTKIKRVFDDGTVEFQDGDSVVADWVAHTLAGKILLPSKEEMLADVYKHYRELDENGIPKRHTHSLRYQIEYVDWLAAQVGLHVEDRLKKIFKKHFEHRMAHPEDYRDLPVF